MKKSLIILAAAALMAAGCSPKQGGDAQLDYEKLNAQALAEYEQPVHPGIRGEVPFWNKYAFKFMYAPAFDFDDIEGATGYTYTAEAGGQFFIFGNESPRAALTEIWTDIPAGPVHLSVQAHDARGESVGEPQVRDFTKDSPFHGPYEEVTGDCHAAAVRAAEAIHYSPIAQNWLKGPEPNLEYPFNSYACKIWSATVQNECFVAKENPAARDTAIAVARAAADCLMRHAQPADAPLAYFPPTYYRSPSGYGGMEGIVNDNYHLTMFVEAVCAAKALLDLYDACGDQKYFDFACNIASTYRKLQAEDGSWPIKVNYTTAEPVMDAPCMPTTILQLAQRLKQQYGVSGYEDMVAKSEKWMWENTISTFNFNGQFEDVRVGDKAPFQNLTNCTAVDCIDYFMGKESPSKEEISACIQMARFAEDQFTLWNAPINERAKEAEGYEPLYRPFVYEQFEFQCPIDHSTAGVAMAWMRVYDATRDPLALAKAKTLINTILLCQDPDNGIIPTVLYDKGNYGIWVNCSWQSITALERMAAIEKGR